MNEGSSERSPLLVPSDDNYVSRSDELESADGRESNVYITKPPLTGILLFSTFVCVIGTSFQFGYNIGVVNAPQAKLETYINGSYFKQTHHFVGKTDYIWAITVSIFCIGGMLGGSLAGSFANWCGRTKAMWLNNITALIAAGLMYASSKRGFNLFELLIGGRFVIGICSGFATGLAPLYLSEISPVVYRGAFGTLNQVVITVGVLVSNILGLSAILGTDENWPILFALCSAPALVQMILLPCCPESPRYLNIVKMNEESARSSLNRLFGSQSGAIVEQTITELNTERTTVLQNISAAESGIMSYSVKDFFRLKSLRRPLLIAVVLQLSQQFSGINAVMFYSTHIFTNVLQNAEAAQYATLALLAMQVIVSFLAAFLVDRLGRRLLMLYGIGGLFLSTCIFTASLLFDEADFLWAKYFTIGSLVIYIIFFSIGPGPIPWLITPELFSQSRRSFALSISVLVNWSAQFIVGFTFPYLETWLDNYVFAPFLVMLAGFWLFIYKFLPETKGKTIQQIVDLFAAE